MTWWWLDTHIAESSLSAPCKHVLHTLAAQINPPDDWEAADPEAWDPDAHPEVLRVRYDRARLSLLTSYSPNTLRLTLKALTAAKDDDGHPLDPVLYRVRPARQHYTAIYGLDLGALRRRRHPALATLEAKRRQAQQAKRLRRSARETPPPPANAIQRAQGKPPENSQRAQHEPPNTSRGLETSPLTPPEGLKQAPLSPQKLSPRKPSPFFSPRARYEKKTGVFHAMKPTRPTPTPPPQGEARRQLLDTLTTWATAEAPGVNAARVLDLWLLTCEAKHYAFPDWLGEGKVQLRAAYYAAHDQDHAPPATRPTCSWAGCDRPPCPHGQACWDHGCCTICDPVLAAAQRAYDAAAAD